MKHFIFFIAITILLAGCGSSRKMSHADMMKDAPDWVQRTPNHPSYFHGVGMASKTPRQDFRERARQNALTELAEGISVTISASSVLSFFEYDNTYSEYFRENVRTSTQQQLEGYELVDNWENDHQYWVYYRLSRARWEQVKQERIDRALSASLSKFEQARTFAGRGNAADALGWYIRSVEDIRDFLGEDLRTAIDGEQRNYSTTLMAELISQFQQLRIEFPVEKLEIKTGAAQSAGAIEALVLDGDKPAPGIPVVTRCSWRPGVTNEAVTDVSGKFRINPARMDAVAGSGQIICAINIDKIIRDNISDMMVRKLLDGLKVNSFVLPVEYVPPSIYLSVETKNHNQPVAGSGVQDELARLLIADGFRLADAPLNADYIMTVEANTVEGSFRSNRFASLLTATFVVRDRAGRTVMSKTENGISGLGGDFMSAGDDAYRSLIGKMRIGIFPDIKRSLIR